MEPGPESHDVTRWTRMEAHDIEYLLGTYWKPIHRFLRSRLRDEQIAEDATQEFFIKFIERDLFRHLDPEKGRFRTFLYHVARQFSIDLVRTRQAAKRGGDRAQVAIDKIDCADTTDLAHPNEEFDRQWFFALLNHARRAVKQNAKPGVYRAFRLFYFGTDRPERWSLKKIALELDVTLSQVKNFLHKARGIYASAIQDQIARYSRTPEEATEELADLARFLERHPVQGPPPTTSSP